MSSIRIDLASLSDCWLHLLALTSLADSVPFQLPWLTFLPRPYSATSIHLCAVSPTDCVPQLRWTKPHTSYLLYVSRHTCPRLSRHTIGLHAREGPAEWIRDPRDLLSINIRPSPCSLICIVAHYACHLIPNLFIPEFQIVPCRRPAASFIKGPRYPSSLHGATTGQVNHLCDHGGLPDHSSGPGDDSWPSTLEGLSTLCF